MTPTRTLGTLFALSFVVQAPSFAQQLCLDPSPGFHVDGVRDLDDDTPLPNIGYVTAVAGFDDANGPSLFVGGHNLESSGAEFTTSLARWDGQAWQNTNVASSVRDLATYDDGNGPTVYALLSQFPWIVKWSGAAFVPLAIQPGSRGDWLDVIDLGSGPELYMSGTFNSIGGMPATGIARWNGSSWTNVPNDVEEVGPLAAFDDGSGLELYSLAHLSNCQDHLRRLDGSTWTGVGALLRPNGCGGGVYDLQPHDDGSGPALYACGNFTTAGGVPALNVARWNGSTWSALADGIFVNFSNGLDALASFDDGDGSKLYATGRFEASPPAISHGVARWNGTSWEPVGGGLGEPGARAATVFDDGNGSRLVVAGDFETAGSAGVWGVASWDGVQWSGFGASGQGAGTVTSLKYFDDGSGPALYAGGPLLGAGQVAANHIARWDGTAWADLDGGMNGDVLDIEVFDEGNGPALYAAGKFTQAGGDSITGIARWDGARWSAVGSGPGNYVYDLLSHGNLLYAALQSAPGVMVWDGSSWNVVGVGISNLVKSLAFYEGSLYATGAFQSVGGVSTGGTARYDTQSDAWSSAGFIFAPSADRLVVHDDGSGPALWWNSHVLGSSLRRLRAGTWTVLSNPGVHHMDTVDFGLGRPSLVSGNLDIFEPGLATWTGSTWVPLTTGIVDEFVYAVEAMPGSESCAPQIFVGGSFEKYDGQISHGIAKLTLCGEPGTAYCFGDGSLATPCPCVPPNTVPNPSGASGHGCANSFNLDGAKLCAVGTTSPDTVTLRANGLTPIGFTQFFKGNAQNGNGVAYADGVRCVDGAILRFGGQNAVLGTAYYPNPALGLNAPLSNAGTPPGSGLTGHYQAIYRNAAPNFCTIDTLNITNAVSITWN